MKKFYYFIPLFILLLSLNLLIFNQDFYAEQVDPLYEEDVSNLLDFFKGGELDTESYTDVEVVHLYDVLLLVKASLAVMLFMIFTILVTSLRESKRVIRKGLINGGIGGLVLTVAFSLLLLNFSSSFLKFHELFFTNDFWMLSSDTLLIQMFPESFFYAAVVHIIFYSLTFSFFSIVLGIRIPKEEKND